MRQKRQWWIVAVEESTRGQIIGVVHWMRLTVAQFDACFPSKAKEVVEFGMRKGVCFVRIDLKRNVHQPSALYVSHITEMVENLKIYSTLFVQCSSLPLSCLFFFIPSPFLTHYDWGQRICVQQRSPFLIWMIPPETQSSFLSFMESMILIGKLIRIF